MKALCIVEFRDIDAGILREVGDVFDVTEERFEAINGTKYGVLAEEFTEEPVEPVEQEAEKPRRRTRKTEE